MLAQARRISGEGPVHIRERKALEPSWAAAGVALCISAQCLGQAPGFYPIGTIDGGDESYIMGFTQDGLAAVGYTGHSGQPAIEHAYRWTAAGGRVDAADAGLLNANTFHGMSSDGSIISGAMSTNTDWRDRRAIVARNGQPVQVLPLLSGWSKVTSAVVISGDGTVVAGTLQGSGAPAPQRGFRWTAAGGIQALPYPRAGDNFMTVRGISRDGSTIVGESMNLAVGLTAAFRWRASTGSQVLPSPLSRSEAHAASANGEVVVGRYTGESGTRAARWDASLSMHDLGTISGSTRNEARAVSDDGLIIGGFVGQPSGSTWRAFIWSPESGMVLADDYFFQNGVAMPADHTSVICDEMSGNGRSFGFRYRRPGHSANNAAIVILGVRCVADFNHDGGIDGSDVGAFFHEWEVGAATSDLNRDGGVDGSDVQVFFESWESGGC